jgi:hypothetical protein
LRSQRFGGANSRTLPFGVYGERLPESLTRFVRLVQAEQCQPPIGRGSGFGKRKLP